MSTILQWASDISRVGLTAPTGANGLPLTDGLQAFCGSKFTPFALDYFLINNSDCLIDVDTRLTNVETYLADNLFADTVTGTFASGNITISLPATGTWFAMVSVDATEGNGSEILPSVVNTGFFNLDDSGGGNYAGIFAGGTSFTVQGGGGDVLNDDDTTMSVLAIRQF